MGTEGPIVSLEDSANGHCFEPNESTPRVHTLSPHLNLALPNGLFPSDVSNESCDCVFLPSECYFNVGPILKNDSPDDSIFIRSAFIS
jgi:hypothetical protein